jgi:hypothetical protein
VGAPVLFRVDSEGLIGAGLRQLGMLLDTGDLQWRRWVLGFSRDEQFGLMRSLGFNTLRRGRWGLLLILPVALFLGLIALRLILLGRVKRDPVSARYRTFCRRLAAVGLVRGEHEGPLDYMQRVSTQRPDLSTQVSVITDLYIRLRYGGDAKPEPQKAFAEQVKRFRPARTVQGGNA